MKREYQVIDCIGCFNPPCNQCISSLINKAKLFTRKTTPMVACPVGNETVGLDYCSILSVATIYVGMIKEAYGEER